jgi:hypothetical protein
MTNFKSFLSFLITSIIIFLIGCFDFIKNSIFDINMDDTLLMSENMLLSDFYSLYLLIIAIIYLILNKLGVILNQNVMKIHFLISIGLILLYWIINLCLCLDNPSKNILFILLLYTNLIFQLFYFPISIWNRKTN